MTGLAGFREALDHQTRCMVRLSSRITHSFWKDGRSANYGGLVLALTDRGIFAGEGLFDKAEEGRKSSCGTADVGTDA